MFAIWWILSTNSNCLSRVNRTGAPMCLGRDKLSVFVKLSSSSRIRYCPHFPFSKSWNISRWWGDCSGGPHAQINSTWAWVVPKEESSSGTTPAHISLRCSKRIVLNPHRHCKGSIGGSERVIWQGDARTSSTEVCVRSPCGGGECDVRGSAIVWTNRVICIGRVEVPRSKKIVRKRDWIFSSSRVQGRYFRSAQCAAPDPVIIQVAVQITGGAIRPCAATDLDIWSKSPSGWCISSIGLCSAVHV